MDPTAGEGEGREEGQAQGRLQGRALLFTYHLAHIHDRGCGAPPHPLRSRFPQMLLPVNPAPRAPYCGKSDRQGPRGQGKAAAAGPRLDRRKEGKGEGRREGRGPGAEPQRAPGAGETRPRGRAALPSPWAGESPIQPGRPWVGDARLGGAQWTDSRGRSVRPRRDLNNKRPLFPEPRGRDCQSRERRATRRVCACFCGWISGLGKRAGGGH